MFPSEINKAKVNFHETKFTKINTNQFSDFVKMQKLKCICYLVLFSFSENFQILSSIKFKIQIPNGFLILYESKLQFIREQSLSVGAMK